MRTLEDVIFRPARPEDGQHIWRLVERIGTLEQNSSYCYLLMARMFGETCCVVEQHGVRVGFLMGFHPPERTSSLFVWQIGVLPDLRGQGLATGLLLQGLAQTEARFVEATVGVSNGTSRALFAGFARRLQVPCRLDDCFRPEHFPERHEPEQLFTIGPIDFGAPAYQGVAEPYMDSLTIHTIQPIEVKS